MKTKPRDSDAMIIIALIVFFLVLIAHIIQGG